MNEAAARDEICRIGQSLFERGYAHATAGNISFQLDDGFLITPTDACIGFLDPARISKISDAGEHLSGDTPSKTIRLHTHIYAAAGSLQQSARCVIHTHSTHCVALSLDEERGELLPPLTPYFVMKVGHVPLLPYRRPGHEELGPLIERTMHEWMAKGIALRAVMLRRIGPNVWHDTPAQAMATLEELEETAKLWHLSGRKAVALDSEQIMDLKTVFRSAW